MSLNIRASDTFGPVTNALGLLKLLREKSRVHPYTQTCETSFLPIPFQSQGHSSIDIHQCQDLNRRRFLSHICRTKLSNAAQFYHTIFRRESKIRLRCNNFSQAIKRHKKAEFALVMRRSRVRVTSLAPKTGMTLWGSFRFLVCQ